jgi:hypothetical protein
MQADDTTRRVFLASAGAAMVGLAGCSGSDDSGDGAGGGGDGPDSTANGSTPAGGEGQTATPAKSDSETGPNCSLLAGDPTAFDAAGTPFVFTFDYVDAWTVQDPLEGPGGRSQGITSPVVRVDGEAESAGVRIGQRFEPLTAAQVDDEIADAVSGDFSPFEVVYELDYADETVRVVGFPDAELAVYRFWLPHDGLYYPVEVDVLSSILNRDEEGQQVLLCLDEIQTMVETVRTTLRPNPETTIESV